MPREPSELEVAEHLAATVRELGDVLRQHVAQAKQDLAREARRQAGLAMLWGMAGGLAFAGLLMMLVVGLGLWTYLFPLWASALIMAAIAFVGAAGAALAGISKARKVSLQKLESKLAKDLPFHSIEEGVVAGVRAAHSREAVRPHPRHVSSSGREPAPPS